MLLLNRKAFTMIELIFVIVIIGILAAVALPKLAATRDDAKVSQLVADARTLLTDFQNFYTSQGPQKWQNETIEELTEVPLHVSNCATPATTSTQISPSVFLLCNGNIPCLTFTTIDEGNLTIADGTTADPICDAVKAVPSIKALSNKEYQLAGKTVKRR